MNAVLILTFVAQVLVALGLTGVLALRLLTPGSSCRPVAAWWQRRIVFAMAPVPGWSPA